MKNIILFHSILSILIILSACFIYGGFDIINADTNFKCLLVFLVFYLNVTFLIISILFFSKN